MGLGWGGCGLGGYRVGGGCWLGGGGRWDGCVELGWGCGGVVGVGG